MDIKEIIRRKINALKIREITFKEKGAEGQIHYRLDKNNLPKILRVTGVLSELPEPDQIKTLNNTGNI